MESSFGEKLKVTIKGGSHEPFISVSIIGLPSNFQPDMKALQAFLDRRAPGKNNLSSSRREADIPVLVSRDPLQYEISNTDVKRSDYDSFKAVPRPGHADYSAKLRYGDEIDMSGGGPFSGRMTAPLCLAGGLALQVLSGRGITIEGKLLSAGSSCGEPPEKYIADAKAKGDSVGGIVKCTATGVPGGIGGAMYDGLESRLSKILFGIPAVKGVEFGAGFRAASMKGSESNDAFYYEDGQVKTRTNNCGGILGGITTGMPITLQVAFKPTPSIRLPQESVNLITGKGTTISVEGRHDPCVALRAVPAVEAAVALGLLDEILVTETAKDLSTATVEEKMTAGVVEGTTEAIDNLSSLRKEIDEIDNTLLDLFSRRMNISKEIGTIKSQENLPVKDGNREDEILARIKDRLVAESFNYSHTSIEPFALEFFTNIFSLSRKYQEGIKASKAVDKALGTYGLIGHPLSHSFSKEVHDAFGEYNFELFDINPYKIESFIKSNRFDGLTVTRPYKQEVIKFCDRLTDRAKQIGAVNTLYKKPVTAEDGKLDKPASKELLIGHNTDYDGFLFTARLSKIEFAGKTALVLGTGGTSKTVSKVLNDEGAKTIYFASRFGGSFTPESSHVYSYDKLNEISNEIEIIINTTPVGTYPGNLAKLISVKDFPSCQAVIDVVYNPMRTALIMEAESLGLKTAGGMPMIVAQGAFAAEHFLGKPGAFSEIIPQVLDQLTRSKENIILIGMPGCGKTTIGKKITQASGKKFVDLDYEICKITGLSIPELFEKKSEEYFRHEETSVAKKYGSQHGQVISTGGGIVSSSENFQALHQNGTIVWLKRPVHLLSTEGRPLSKGTGSLKKLAKERIELYDRWADFAVDSSALFELLGI